VPLTILYLDINTEWRGGQRQLLWMGEGLLRHGGRPIFALRTGVPLAARARETGIEVIAIDPLIAEWGPWTVLRLRRVIKRERVAIVHAQSGHTMALAALASLGTRAKIVLRAPGDDAAAREPADALEVCARGSPDIRKPGGRRGAASRGCESGARSGSAERRSSRFACIAGDSRASRKLRSAGGRATRRARRIAQRGEGSIDVRTRDTSRAPRDSGTPRASRG
jgi:hypothetical protein